MKYVGLLLGCLILVTSSALQAMSQSRTRTVAPQFVAAPIKVTTPPINVRKKYAGHWISQPIALVENVSNKPIQYLVIEASLPGAKEPFLLAFGQAPGKPAAANVEPLQPGAKISLNVTQHSCEWTQKSLLEIDTRTLAGNHVTATINGVVFNDKTAWFDGVAHVMDPNNPLRWHVVRNTAQTDSPMFSFLKVSNSQSCYDWLDTVFIDCCGLQRASAVLVLAPFSSWQPLPRQTECQPGVICEWIKAVGCSGGTF
jgi:hypothetical protein